MVVKSGFLENSRGYYAFLIHVTPRQVQLPCSDMMGAERSNLLLELTKNGTDIASNVLMSLYPEQLCRITSSDDSINKLRMKRHSLRISPHCNRLPGPKSDLMEKEFFF